MYWCLQGTFKSNTTQDLMTGFLTVDETTYMPIGGFTTVDLGCERGNNAYFGNQNRLHPFYMVYIGEDGEVICDHLSPKELLDRMRLICKEQSEPDKELCRTFNDETKDGREMGVYHDSAPHYRNAWISEPVNARADQPVAQLNDLLHGNVIQIRVTRRRIVIRKDPVLFFLNKFTRKG